MVADNVSCANYVNLSVQGIWTGGTLQQCAELAAGAGVSQGCSAEHKYFQFYADTVGDCVCATDDCQARTVNNAGWAIYSYAQATSDVCDDSDISSM